jgi:hypothetical protein
MKNSSIKVGDLVLCKAKIDPSYDYEDKNIKLVIGWITKKTTTTFMDGKFTIFHVQWSDKETDGELKEEDALSVRNFFLKMRKEWGI